MAYNIIQEASITRIVVWYTTVAGIMLKIFSLIIHIRISGNGRSLLRRLWKKTYVFFPPISSQESEAVDLQGRVIGIIWLESICAFFTLSLAICVQMQLSWSPVFTTASPFTPLINFMYGKGITGILYVLGMLHHTDVLAVLSEFGCTRYCKKYKRFDSRGKELPKVLVDTPFLKFNGFLKFVDIVVSALLWISLIMSTGLGGLDQPKEVRVVLGAMIVLTSLSSLHGLMLALIVLW